MASKSTMAFDPADAAKEFEGEATMDDRTAFLEAGGPAAATSTAAVTTGIRWRPGNSLTRLRNQLDRAYPNRSKASDGFIGDATHCPNPDGTGDSDHCPNIVDGDYRVVTAFDATHDPAEGCDMEEVTAKIVDSRDQRVKYIIWNRRICNSTQIGSSPPWTWRPYGGSNPHDRHAHFSVLGDKAKYDDATDWRIR